MKYTAKFRIWHWLNAFVIFGLLMTVALKESFLDVGTNAKILMEELTKISVTIDAKQAKIIAKVFREEMWHWHIYLGYFLIALIAFRIFLIFKDSSNKEKFLDISLHKKAVRVLYFLFYLVLIGMSISGLALTFEDELNIDEEKIEELHELGFNLIIGFIVAHISGVIIAENRSEKGLVSTIV